MRLSFSVCANWDEISPRILKAVLKNLAHWALNRANTVFSVLQVQNTNPKVADLIDLGEENSNVTNQMAQMSE